MKINIGQLRFEIGWGEEPTPPPSINPVGYLACAKDIDELAALMVSFGLSSDINRAKNWMYSPYGGGKSGNFEVARKRAAGWYASRERKRMANK